MGSHEAPSSPHRPDWLDAVTMALIVFILLVVLLL